MKLRVSSKTGGRLTGTAVVVYESMFGNTRQIAEAVAEGIGSAGTVDVLGVQRATPGDVGSADLVVLGAPTHAFSLSRPATRAEAHDRGATEGSQIVGMREWLTEVSDLSSARLVAVFDTRVSRVRRLPGSAARKVAGIARKLGAPVTLSASFYVADVAGPLLPGELDRARAWGRHLALGSTEA